MIIIGQVVFSFYFWIFHILYAYAEVIVFQYVNLCFEISMLMEIFLEEIQYTFDFYVGAFTSCVWLGVLVLLIIVGDVLVLCGF